MKKLATTSGTTFVLAWIAGLLVAGGGPKPTDSAAEIAAYFAAHERTAMLQHFLIDAVAGGALIGIALLARRHSRVAFTAGVTAASVSLVQFAIGEAMAISAANGARPSTVHGLFTALNNADTVKIAFLATMIAAVAATPRRSSALPAWLTRASLAFAPLLALSGLAFPLESDPLYSLLYLSLPLLLIWVAAFATVSARRPAAPVVVVPAAA